MGAGPTVILSAGLFDIIFEKSVVYYGILVALDILGVVGMLRVCISHFMNEKNDVQTTDETAWTMDPREMAEYDDKKQGLSLFSNVTVFQ